MKADPPSNALDFQAASVQTKCVVSESMFFEYLPPLLEIHLLKSSRDFPGPKSPLIAMLSPLNGSLTMMISQRVAAYHEPKR